MRIRFILIICFIFLINDRLYSQLLFHNTSTERVFVAIKYLKSNKWITKGWFAIEPLQTNAVPGRLTNRFYYCYAYSNKRVWSGSDSWSWIHPTKGFTTFDDKKYSPDNGFKKVGMYKIDVGTSGKFTQTLESESKFVKQIEEYLLHSRRDSIEGLYTVSDNITIETINFFGEKTLSKPFQDHWAKVAIVKDTTSVTTRYVELVIEAEGFKEGDVRAEFVRKKESQNTFITDQLAEPEGAAKSIVLDYNEDLIEGKFEYITSNKKYLVKRSYIKYFPK